VVLVTVAALRGITRSQADAARVAGGEGPLAWLAARSVWPTSLLTALLTGALTLSDAGPGQIFGVRGAAGEILVSFSAQYDFAHAARQCLALALVAAVVALPVVLFPAPRLDAALLARAGACPAQEPIGLTRGEADVFAGGVQNSHDAGEPVADSSAHLRRSCRRMTREA